VTQQRTIEYRKVSAGHRSALRAFADRIPFSDRSFFDAQLLEDSAVASWTQAVPARRVAAFDGDDVVGLVTVVPRWGWMAHVGEMRVITQPSHRGRGLGRGLVDQGLALADELGVEKVTVEIRASNPGALAMFEAAGFAAEARLVGQVRDTAGNLDDLLVVSRWTGGPAPEPGG
jgi:ribosomal protein S18 acetylase RimI-like enzyme